MSAVMKSFETWFNEADTIVAKFDEQHVFFFKIQNFVVKLTIDTAHFFKKMTEAFLHLQISPVSAPDLTIYLWETSCSKNKIPSIDWGLVNKNDHHGFSVEPYYFHFFPYINAFSAIDLSRNVAHYVVRNTEALPWWVGGSPLQVILHAWFRERGLQLTHVAAVSNRDGAVLFTGKGGSGKSTTTLSCLLNGFGYIGEDYCFISNEGIPTVYSVYQSAKWEKNTRTLFPQFEEHIKNKESANQEKALIFYRDIFNNQIMKKAPILAMLSLSVDKTKKEPILSKNSFELGLQDLMMSTLFQLPFSHEKTISVLKEMVRKIPCYRLVLGTDLDKNLSLIEKILLDKKREI